MDNEEFLLTNVQWSKFKFENQNVLNHCFGILTQFDFDTSPQEGSRDQRHHLYINDLKDLFGGFWFSLRNVSCLMFGFCRPRHQILILDVRVQTI